MPTRTTTNIEHAHAGLQLQRIDEIVDLTHGALGERVTKVRRTHVFGERFEPVLLLDRLHRYPLAAAQV